MPDCSTVSEDDELVVLEGALAEVESARDHWDTVAREIEAAIVSADEKAVTP